MQHQRDRNLTTVKYTGAEIIALQYDTDLFAYKVEKKEKGCLRMKKIKIIFSTSEKKNPQKPENQDILA
jgi:hypothetical protein